MSELVIKNLEDLKKLSGWTIEKAGKVANATPACTIGLLLSHPAAERKVVLKFWPTVTFGRAGNIMLVNESLKIEVLDTDEIIKEEESHE